MKLTAEYTVEFTADGTEDTLEFDLTDAPLSIDLSGTDPSGLSDADFRVNPNQKIPAVPFMKECTLDGTKVTATFAGPLPGTDFEKQPAIYSLSFRLAF
jgi:hypothetical protein